MYYVYNGFYVFDFIAHCWATFNALRALLSILWRIKMMMMIMMREITAESTGARILLKYRNFNCIPNHINTNHINKMSISTDSNYFWLSIERQWPRNNNSGSTSVLNNHIVRCVMECETASVKREPPNSIWQSLVNLSALVSVRRHCELYAWLRWRSQWQLICFYCLSILKPWTVDYRGSCIERLPKSDMSCWHTSGLNYIVLIRYL